MTLDQMFLVLAVAALVVAIPLGLYVWSIYNDLVTRRSACTHCWETPRACRPAGMELGR